MHEIAHLYLIGTVAKGAKGGRVPARCVHLVRTEASRWPLCTPSEALALLGAEGAADEPAASAASGAGAALAAHSEIGSRSAAGDEIGAAAGEAVGGAAAAAVDVVGLRPPPNDEAFGSRRKPAFVFATLRALPSRVESEEEAEAAEGVAEAAAQAAAEAAEAAAVAAEAEHESEDAFAGQPPMGMSEEQQLEWALAESSREAARADERAARAAERAAERAELSAFRARGRERRREARRDLAARLARGDVVRLSIGVHGRARGPARGYHTSRTERDWRRKPAAGPAQGAQQAQTQQAQTQQQTQQQAQQQAQAQRQAAWAAPGSWEAKRRTALSLTELVRLQVTGGEE